MNIYYNKQKYTIYIIYIIDKSTKIMYNIKYIQKQNRKNKPEDYQFQSSYRAIR